VRQITSLLMESAEVISCWPGVEKRLLNNNLTTIDKTNGERFYAIKPVCWRSETKVINYRYY